MKKLTRIKPFLYIIFWFNVFIPFASIRAQQSSLNFDPYRYSIKKRSTGSNGAVVSAHPLASQAGLQMLKMGGNAFDAAIATQLALAVVYPGAGNIGGGGFLVAFLQNGRTLAIDYREKAPAAAHRDMYLDQQGNALPDLSQSGHLASGVPGTVAGLFATHRYAKLDFKKLIHPAIELAEKGFVITADEASSLNETRNEFLKYNTIRPVFVKSREWKAGDTLIQTDLGSTLKRIRDHGMQGFYEGETAKLIVEEMNRGKGIISLADLKNYQAKERQVTDFTYKGYRIISMPLPSSGGILIQQMLNMTGDRNIASMGMHSPEAVQLMIEVERRAYADRAQFLGDQDMVRVPVKKLTSSSYLQERMLDYKPGVSGNSKDVKAGIINPESEETTHLSVSDKWGNAVAVTTTLNGGYGAYTVVGGAGFLLNNEMDDFSIKPGVPNMYGALGTEANAIAPGKRMLSSMTPTIVIRKNKPFLVLGTPGGTTIPTSVFQTIVNIIEFNQNTVDAVNLPKFHHQWLPDVVYLENGFPEKTKEALKKMGYEIKVRGQIGRTEVIRIDYNKKGKMKMEAVGDRRGDDDARTF